MVGSIWPSKVSWIRSQTWSEELRLTPSLPSTFQVSVCIIPTQIYIYLSNTQQYNAMPFTVLSIQFSIILHFMMWVLLLQVWWSSLGTWPSWTVHSRFVKPIQLFRTKCLRWRLIRTLWWSAWLWTLWDYWDLMWRGSRSCRKQVSSVSLALWKKFST